MPEWPQFMRGCIRYRQSLDEQLPGASRTSEELAPPDPMLVVLRFNAAINERDLEGLLALMTDDHCFIDSENRRIEGREALREAWQGFFAAFPDYRNDFATVCRRGQLVLVVGRSRCSEPALDGPVVWTTIVRDALVAEWRVYTDGEETRRSLGLALGDALLA